MPESPQLLLASEDPQELIVLMHIAADGSIEPRDRADSEIEPRDRARRRGFQIALEAVSAPQVAGAADDEYPRPAVVDSHELVELLLSAVVAKISPDDQETLAGVEVALEAVLSFNERPASEVLAESFAAASQ
jgi:hypothetical protein